jgi:hypothetical protein
MDDSAERYNRIVRAPADDLFLITPPISLLNEAERLGQDPRVPRTAVARFVAKTWAETQREGIRRNVQPMAATHSEKELMERPAHFPTDFGLSLIPFPDDVGDWIQDKIETVCYTSLSVPRPFDPHLHGDVGSPAATGFGYNYYGGVPVADRYSIVNRRGGGPRGGFAMTSGPTEGNYPSSILPSPTFNLGVLGFSDGGFNPEGLQYTNRPREVKLTGLRNGWAHKVFFARSRQVMFRNLYGPISETEATPKAPTVVINGNRPLGGVLSISTIDRLNAPRQATISVSSICGRRTGMAKIGDTIQIYAAPRMWANPPLVFTGIVTDLAENINSLSIVVTDALGVLANEIIGKDEFVGMGDAAAVIKSIIAKSSYSLPIGRIAVQSKIFVPTDLNLTNKSRLAGVQTVLQMIQQSPNPYLLNVNEDGYVQMKALPEIDDTSVQPLTAGSLPRTDKPLDFHPTNVSKSSGDLDFFNVVTMVSSAGEGIELTYPPKGSSEYPTRPVVRLIRDNNIQTESEAEMRAKAYLADRGRTRVRYAIEGLPERFDIRAGDVMEFATHSGIAGRHRIYGVQWVLEPNGSTMKLDVGREAPNLIATLKFAQDLSQ